MNHRFRVLSLTVATLLAPTVRAEPLPGLTAEPAASSRPAPSPMLRSSARAKPSTYVAPTTPAVEPLAAAANTAASMNTNGVFSAGKSAQSVTPSSTTLNPPVSIVYSGSSPAINVATTGISKAVQASINNTANTSSALYGQTNGAGGGVTGYNGGTTGYAGKFGVTNTASKQAAILASTIGTGPALLATTTSTSMDAAPAVYGKSQGAGFGVQGDSPDNVGVWGQSTSGGGVVGITTSGIGTYGQSDSGVGVSAYSTNGVGLEASSHADTAVRALSDQAMAVEAQNTSVDSTVFVKNSGSGWGLEVQAVGNAVNGTSTKSIGVSGQSVDGYGVYGVSKTSYAGYFDGKVAAKSYTTLSDRNAKTHFKAIDGGELLARVNRLPITTWDFKTDPGKKHLGPMAQDFHAAFGLDGTDDKHINLTDIAGVSLAAIQELTRQGQLKDAKIAALSARVDALTKTLESRLTALEQRAIDRPLPAALRDRRSARLAPL